MIENDNEKYTNLSMRELMGFFPKQVHALEMANKFKYLLYGGSAGPGKSYWLRWYSVYKLLKWSKDLDLRGITSGLFCEDYPSLKDRHIGKIAYEMPDWLGEIKDSKEHGLGFHIRPELGGAIMALRNLDDPSKYLSSEFALAAVDELTRNEEHVFNVLRMRLRWTGIEDVRFIAATNPGQKGHGWVKKRWIDRLFDANETEPDEFFYVPALPTDNPHLAKSYIQQLQSLPEKERKAYLEGDWNVFAGQFFTEFSQDIHVCTPFEIPDDWFRYINGDYGYSNQSAIYWNAIDPNGKIYTYRELYITERTGETLAEEILEMTPERERPLIDWAVMDSNISTTGKEGRGEISVLDQMIEVFEKAGWDLALRLASKGPGSRINGWNLMRGYLRAVPNEEGKIEARWQIFPSCENLIRTIPVQVYNEKAGDPEDLDTDVEDHAVDSMRYGFRALAEPFVKEKKEDKTKKPEIRGNVAARIARIMGEDDDLDEYYAPTTQQTHEESTYL